MASNISLTYLALSTQNITILVPDGSEIVVNMHNIDIQTQLTTISALQYGAQMGACIVMLVLLIILTNRASMLKPLFILNLASLILAFFRALFLALYTVSPWLSFYVRFAHDYSSIPRIHFSNSVAGTVFPVLLTITVNGSLMLQAHAVCTQLHTALIKYLLLSISTAIILVVVGFRMAQCITNIQVIFQLQTYPDRWLPDATVVSSSISIWWFMSIFMVKLAYTLWMRKKMGWARMSVFQTLAVAGGCTMLTPSIFAVLQYAIPDHFPEAGTWPITATALLLPLSTLWAKMTVEEEATSLRQSRASQDSSHSQHSRVSNHVFNSQSSTVAGSESRKGSVSPMHYVPHQITIDTIVEHDTPLSASRDSTEVDLKRMGVRVDRSYRVESGNY